MPQPKERDFALLEDYNAGIRCRVAAIVNVTISTGLVPGQVVNGVTLTKGMYVLLTAQTAPAENGVYVSDTVPYRLEPFSTQERNAGAAFDRLSGQLITTTSDDSLWICGSSRGFVLGTDPLSITRLIGGAGGTYGAYLPILSNVANVTGTTAFTTLWIRMGDQVNVTGRLNVNPTAGGSAVTTVGISLPIVSDLTAGDGQCNGPATIIGHSGGLISGDTANNRALLTFLSVAAGNNGCGFSFTYVVQ